MEKTAYGTSPTTAPMSTNLDGTVSRVSSGAHSAVDSMAACTGAFSVVHGLAARRIADDRGRALRRGERAEIRDDFRCLLDGHVRGRHRCVGDPGADDPHQVLVRELSSELAAAEIDAGNQVAVGSVAVAAGHGLARERRLPEAHQRAQRLA